MVVSSSAGTPRHQIIRDTGMDDREMETGKQHIAHTHTQTQRELERTRRRIPSHPPLPPDREAEESHIDKRTGWFQPGLGGHLKPRLPI